MKPNHKFVPGQLVWAKARIVCTYTEDNRILLEALKPDGEAPTTGNQRYHARPDQVKPRRLKKRK